MTEKAKESVTAKGKPSGIATTTTVIAISKKSTMVPPVSAPNLADEGSIDISSMMNLTNRTTKMQIAEISPKIPIS